MNTFLCPHCHVLLLPGELDEIATGGRRYFICPECDEPFLTAAVLPTDSTARPGDEARDA